MLCGSPPRAYNRKDPGPAIPDPARFCPGETTMPFDEEEIYQEHILDHYEDPYHRGQLRDCTHCHEDDNPLCGDVVRMDAAHRRRREDPRGLFRRRRLLHQPGGGLDAGRAVRRQARSTRSKQFTADDMLELFGVRLTPNRQKCCLLSWRVLQAAIYSPVDASRPAPSVRTSARRNAHDAPRESAPLDPAALSPRFPDPLAGSSTAMCRWCILDNAASTQRPRQVIAGDRRDLRASTTPTSTAASTRWPSEADELYEEAREKVRAFINAARVDGERDHLHLRHDGRRSTWSPAAGATRTRAPATKSSLTEMEHHSNLVPWQQLAERTGAGRAPHSDDRRRPARPRRARQLLDRAARSWWP